jgi:hypothetical protein
LVASDGGIFSFGDAKFYGSTGRRNLAHPIVGMARTRTGKGYWLLGSDGAAFNFGDAKFFGGLGRVHGARGTAVGIAPALGGGYWIESQR